MTLYWTFTQVLTKTGTCYCLKDCGGTLKQHSSNQKKRSHREVRGCLDTDMKSVTNILQFFILFYFSYKARYNSVLSKHCTFLLSVNRAYVNICHHTVSPFKDHKKMVKVKSYSTKVLVYLNSVLYEASYTTTESSCSGLWGTIALCKN